MGDNSNMPHLDLAANIFMIYKQKMTPLMTHLTYKRALSFYSCPFVFSMCFIRVSYVFIYWASSATIINVMICGCLFANAAPSD